MTRRWLFGLILLTVLNLSALGAFLYHRFEPEHAHMEPPGPVFMRKELGLSDEQIARMQSHRATFHPRVTVFSDEMHRQRLALVRELMAEEPDSLELERIVTEIGSLQVALQRNVVRHLLAEKAIFTPAQREKFFSLVLERFAVDTKQGGYRPQP